MQGVTRRELLVGAAAGAGAWLLTRGAPRAGEALPAAARAALEKSRLVYVSPLLAGGRESTCHGEVWFTRDGDDVIVCTAADRWKVRALGRGLDRARLWVGEYGVWKRAAGRFREAPSFDARAALEADPEARERALRGFGARYPDEWGKWGPRFRQGLADGSRVLVRYRPAAG